MKIKHLVIISFLLLGLFMFNSCDWIFGIDVTGTWDMLYDWGCTGSPYSAVWYINEDGSFSDDQQNSGTWELSGSDFAATYSNGTVYSGTVNDAGTEMDGTMLSPDSYTGCWSATIQ